MHKTIKLASIIRLPFSSMLGYFILFVISLVFIRSLSSFSWKKSRLPPSPFALPVIGHLHLLSKLPHQDLCNLSRRYGPVFRFLLGSTPCLAVSSPEMAKEIFRSHEPSFLDRPRNSATVYITYGSKDFVFAPFDSYWKFMKKLVVTELFNSQTLDSLFYVRQDEINRFMNLILGKAKLGKAVDLKSQLLMLTNNVITRMIMNERCSEDENEARDMGELVPQMLEITGEFNLADFIWFFSKIDLQGIGKRVRKIRQQFDDFMDRVIKEHEDGNKRKDKDEAKDLLDILLKISQDDAMELKLTKDHIKAFIQNLFVAGTDTSSLTIEWGLAELINHPRILQRAVEEIDRVVGKTRLIEETDIQHLPYLQAIVKETLRLHPTVPILLRTSTEDCTVGGFHIPAKTTVYINTWAMGRDPKNWDDPLEFRPERFLESQVDVKGQHYQILPFGTGRRMCPGRSFALQVIHVALGAMVQCFEWKAGEKGDITQVDMEEGPGFSLSRANPLVCIPVARLDDSIIQSRMNP